MRNDQNIAGSLGRPLKDCAPLVGSEPMNSTQCLGKHTVGRWVFLWMSIAEQRLSKRDKRIDPIGSDHSGTAWAWPGCFASEHRATRPLLFVRGALQFNGPGADMVLGISRARRSNTYQSNRLKLRVWVPKELEIIPSSRVRCATWKDTYITKL